MRGVVVLGVLVAVGGLCEKAPGDELAEAVKVILDDDATKERREEAIAAHKEESAALLKRLVEGLEPGTPEELRRIPWVWRVTVAAGKRNDVKELGEVLDASLPAEDGRLLEWQAVVIGGGVINGIGLAGGWPDERIEAVLKQRPELRSRWERALRQSFEMADDEKVIPGTRYDALRMIALADWKRARPVLERYLGHENAELQQGAVSGLSDVRDDEAPRLLLSRIDELTESNRVLAVEALVRDGGRYSMAKEGLRLGVLNRKEIEEARAKRGSGTE